MPPFVHIALLSGLAAVALPVLIHLINMLRHRRVAWAAMEFLLVSQKKNRTWVLLKQLLLLALRMAAIAVLVLVVAQPLFRDEFAGIGRSTTHHIVLLDDSFSMSDRWENTGALDQARQVVQRLGDAITERSDQSFTLLRFSLAGRGARGTEPDMLQEAVDSRFAGRLADFLDGIKPSQSAAGPSPAMEAVDQLFSENAAETRVVYLLSDFRSQQWNDASPLRDHLLRWTGAKVRVKLIQCVDAAHPNLSITRLAAGPGIRAAGVQTFMEVTVQNFGQTPVRDLPVTVEADGVAQPGLSIVSIPPYGAVKERFPVRFPTAGEHRIVARLEADAVAADNARYAVVDFPPSVPVLLVDSDPQAPDARYLDAVFKPGGAIPTGLAPRIETPRYLTADTLAQFRTVYLLNVGRLEKSTIAALENYVRNGGGVAFFLGEQAGPEFYNRELYRNGDGLFPLPLANAAELLIDYLEKAPDLEVTHHPIFQVFSGERNSFLPLVNVARYFTAPKNWQPAETSGVQVIARLRNKAPLVVERSFGAGRVVAFLTTAGPTWNNWARANPSFVVAMLELQAHLAGRPAEESPRLVGAPLEVHFDAVQYQPEVRFIAPNENAQPAGSIDATVGAVGRLAAVLLGTDAAGFYEARLTDKNGKQETRRFACNVRPEEGDLRRIDAEGLTQRLDGVKCDLQDATRYQYSPEEHSGYNMSGPLLYLLILLLLGEQVLAWSASYHPPAKSAATAGGAS